MELPPLHAALARELRALQRTDGGFSPAVAGESEVESTAVAALALGDPRARGWLDARQADDGGFQELDGRRCGPAAVALAALTVDGPERRLKALDYAIAQRGLQPPGASDPGRRSAWGWTTDARSTVEPTSRVLIATNVLTPADAKTRREAIRLLAERQCDDGGWNYGNASVNDVDLRGYAQTTAMALIGLQGGPEALVSSGLSFLRSHWRGEPGELTAAQALLAFRLQNARADARLAVGTLHGLVRRRSAGVVPLTLAWSVLATAPPTRLDVLRSRA